MPHFKQAVPEKFEQSCARQLQHHQTNLQNEINFAFKSLCILADCCTLYSITSMFSTQPTLNLTILQCQDFETLVHSMTAFASHAKYSFAQRKEKIVLKDLVCSFAPFYITFSSFKLQFYRQRLSRSCCAQAVGLSFMSIRDYALMLMITFLSELSFQRNFSSNKAIGDRLAIRLKGIHRQLK